jgi:hypothetical protein
VGCLPKFQKGCAGMPKFCQTTCSYPFVTCSHQRALLSHYSFSLVEGMCFSLSCVLLSCSSLWILLLIFFNLFLQSCLSEVGVVSNAVYIGGGHGASRAHGTAWIWGWHRTRAWICRRQVTCFLLPSRFTSPLSFLRRGHDGEHHRRHRPGPRCGQSCSSWRRQQLLFLHDGNNSDGRVLGTRVDLGVPAEE